MKEMIKEKRVSHEVVRVTNPKCNIEQDLDIKLGYRPGERNWLNVYQSNLRLESATEHSLRREQFTIVFGGDHSQAIGSINGLKNVHPNSRILWVDAHVDVNTPQSTKSGNIHGQPVAFLAGLHPEQQAKVLSLKDIIYFGLRQWEPEEMQLINSHRIPWYQSKICTPERISQIKKEVQSHFFKRGKKDPYWISFDIDSLDPEYFRSTGTVESGGLSVDFVLRLFEAFLPEAVGMDFTEVNFLQADDYQVEKDKQLIRFLMESIIDIVHREQMRNIVYQTSHRAYIQNLQ